MGKACFLPEASDFIVPTQQECYDLSRPISSHVFTNGLREVAKEWGVWVFVGVHELPSEKDAEEVKRESEEGRKVFNSLVVITDEGEVEETYRKVGHCLFVYPCSSLICLGTSVRRGVT